MAGCRSLGLFAVQENDNDVYWDESDGQRGTKDCHHQEGQRPGDPAAALVALPIVIVFHTASRPNPSMKDLGELEANVGASSHVAAPNARAQMLDPAKKPYLELALSAATWTGVPCEIMQADRDGHLIASGSQSC